MGHDEGFPKPQFSQPELVEPQNEGAQATYDPEDAIVFETAFEFVQLTSRSEERVQRKVCNSFREICRQGLFQNIMKMKWSYKRHYGAKLRKAIFGATVNLPHLKI